MATTTDFPIYKVSMRFYRQIKMILFFLVFRGHVEEKSNISHIRTSTQYVHLCKYSWLISKFAFITDFAKCNIYHTTSKSIVTLIFPNKCKNVKYMYYQYYLNRIDSWICALASCKLTSAKIFPFSKVCLKQALLFKGSQSDCSPTALILDRAIYCFKL